MSISIIAAVGGVFFPKLSSSWQLESSRFTFLTNF